MLVLSKEELRRRLERLLRRHGLSPEMIERTEALWERLAHEDVEVVVVERTRLSGSPRRFVSALRRLPDPPAIIVLSPEENPAERAELLASGCHAVLWLGVDDRRLGDALAAVIRRQGDEVLDRLQATRSIKRSSLDEFVASSPSMQRFLRLARRVVRSDSPLLILGETGVGKERLARSIHSESPRSTGPWITVNCGALPESLLESELFGHEEGAFTGATRARRGYFELAHRGTLFLDEIGEMPYHLQVRLLRVIEDRTLQRVGGERPIQVDVRVIAATNRDLHADMEAGRFRPDLYYRLAVVTLNVPPLRERREDIPNLARTFLERFQKQFGRPVDGLSPRALAALIRYQWPGNVRELMNVIERAVLLAAGPLIDVEDLRGGESWTEAGPTRTDETGAMGDGWERYLELPLSSARKEVLARFERRYLHRLLQATRGRVGEAARRAGINERSLYALMKRHRLRKEDFKRNPSDGRDPWGAGTVSSAPGGDGL